MLRVCFLWIATSQLCTVYPKKYAHGLCFAVLCSGHTLTDFPISIRLTLLALWQSNDCPSASKATLMNMDNTSCEFIMNDCITTTKQSTTKPCAYFELGYTVVCGKLALVIVGHPVPTQRDDLPHTFGPKPTSGPLYRIMFNDRGAGLRQSLSWLWPDTALPMLIDLLYYVLIRTIIMAAKIPCDTVTMDTEDVKVSKSYLNDMNISMAICRKDVPKCK